MGLVLIRGTGPLCQPARECVVFCGAHARKLTASGVGTSSMFRFGPNRRPASEPQAAHGSFLADVRL